MRHALERGRAPLGLQDTQAPAANVDHALRDLTHVLGECLAEAAVDPPVGGYSGLQHGGTDATEEAEGVALLPSPCGSTQLVDHDADGSGVANASFDLIGEWPGAGAWRACRGVDALDSFIAKNRARGTVVLLTRVQPLPLKVLREMGLLNRLGPDAVQPNLTAALAKARVILAASEAAPAAS